MARADQSHLLQMRGLKPSTQDVAISFAKSHLLQMRGLKQKDSRECDCILMSHLLQMRGLKQNFDDARKMVTRRIFYRCVD